MRISRRSVGANNVVGPKGSNTFPLRVPKAKDHFLNMFANETILVPCKNTLHSAESLPGGRTPIVNFGARRLLLGVQLLFAATSATTAQTQRHCQPNAATARATETACVAEASGATANVIPVGEPQPMQFQSVNQQPTDQQSMRQQPMDQQPMWQQPT